MSGGAAGGTSAASGAAAGGGTLGGAAGGGPSARLRVAVFGLTPTSIHYLTYVRFLASRGHYVTCLTNAPRVDAPVRVVDFTRYRALAARLPRGVRMLPKLALMTECLLNRRFDVLDIMQVTPDGVLAALIWRGPLVLDFWGSDVLRLDQRPWWVRWLMPRVLAKAGAIHSVSQQMTTELVRLELGPRVSRPSSTASTSASSPLPPPPPGPTLGPTPTSTRPPPARSSCRRAACGRSTASRRSCGRCRTCSPANPRRALSSLGPTTSRRPVCRRWPPNWASESASRSSAL